MFPISLPSVHLLSVSSIFSNWSSLNAACVCRSFSQSSALSFFVFPPNTQGHSSIVNEARKSQCPDNSSTICNNVGQSWRQREKVGERKPWWTMLRWPARRWHQRRLSQAPKLWWWLRQQTMLQLPFGRPRHGSWKKLFNLRPTWTHRGQLPQQLTESIPTILQSQPNSKLILFSHF